MYSDLLLEINKKCRAVSVFSEITLENVLSINLSTVLNCTYIVLFKSTFVLFGTLKKVQEKNAS